MSEYLEVFCIIGIIISMCIACYKTWTTKKDSWLLVWGTIMIIACIIMRYELSKM